MGLILGMLLLLSLQSCPTLCDPIDSSPPGSTVPGILQARTLEWVAISFSNAWKWKVKMKSLSCVWLFVTPWTAAYQASPSMRFSRQEHWSGLPLPFPNLRYEYYLKINVHLNELWRFLYHFLKTNFFFFYHFLWKLLHKCWDFKQYMVKWHSISMCNYHHYPYPELFNHHKQKLCT